MAGRRKLKPDGNKPTDAPCRIRRGTPADAPALVAIERRAFADPWSEASFREGLSAAWSFGLVAEQDDEIVGYLIAREAGGSGEILNLAVDPPRRRAGVARALLEVGLAVLRRRGAEETFLEVRESNLAAQALYLAAGFRPVGQRAGYYRNPLEDALVLRLGPSAGR
ncbi:MAG: ribosomal protein S18-alanine N-acetyltransferase [Gemmatimonadales bacterium]